MHFQIELLENGTKNIFQDKQSENKVPLALLGANVLTEM